MPVVLPHFYPSTFPNQNEECSNSQQSAPSFSDSGLRFPLPFQSDTWRMLINNIQFLLSHPFQLCHQKQTALLLCTALHIDNKIFQRMIGKTNKEQRLCHSEEKRRSVGLEESRRNKMERMKMRFRNITRQISQIKKQNDSDINQLNNLIQSSDQLQLMASQSLEKAKMILSQSKINKKRVTSPTFHQVKHAQPVDTSEFAPQLPPQLQSRSSQPQSTSGKKKNRFSKHSAHRTKTEETSESEVPRRNSRIERISETELFQQSSLVREQCIKERPEQQSIIRQSGKFPTKQSKAETSKANLYNSTKFNSFISMRNSLKKSQDKTQDSSAPKRKTQSIYPYIAIILLSILLMISLRE